MIYHLQKYISEGLDYPIDRIFIDGEPKGADNEYILLSESGGANSNWIDQKAEVSLQILVVSRDRFEGRQLTENINTFLSDKCDFIIDTPELLPNNHRLKGAMKILSLTNTQRPSFISSEKRGEYFSVNFLVKFKDRILNTAEV